VIDLATDTNVADLPIFSRPVDVRISPDSTTAYVVSISGTDRLYFVNLDGPSSSVTGSIIIGQMGAIGYTYSVTSGMALSPDGSVLALWYSLDDQLGLVDTVTQSEIIRVPVGDFPIRVAFSPNGTLAYVANSFSDDLSEVRVAGIHSFVVATVGPIEFPLPVNVDDTGSYVYVGSFESTSTTRARTFTSAASTRSIPRSRSWTRCSIPSCRPSPSPARRERHTFPPPRMCSTSRRQAARSLVSAPPAPPRRSSTRRRCPAALRTWSSRSPG
jgi:DNA-binding beta-propeller fold protein YncE